MHKALILISVLTFLSLVAYLLIQKNAGGKNVGVTADRGFTVKEFKNVKKIVVKHVKLQPMVFSNDGNGWKINGKYNVDPAVFIHIENVLKNINLLYVPPTNTTATILNSIKSNGIQVDIYENGEEPSKIIHIGSDTPKNDGTYMVLGGSKQPFAMHLPGLAGGIRSRFEQPLENYRNKFIFQQSINDIKQISVEYPKSKKHSFKIISINSEFQIEPLIDLNQNSLEINQILLKSYLSGFENLGAEKIINSYPSKNSIIGTVPACTIELIDRKGNVIKHRYFVYDEIENGPVRSPGEIRFQNRMYVLVDSLDFYVVQNRVFGDIFRGYDEFIRLSK